MTPRIQPMSVAAPGNRAIVIFPHAGGSPRYYAPWSRAAPAGINVYGVVYPGRDQLLDFPASESLVSLALETAAEMEPIIASSDSVVTFGHSMGAYIAFEVARLLESSGMPITALVASGADAPHRRVAQTWHRASDDDLIEHVGALDARSRDALAIPELRTMFLPSIRDDYRLVETYRGAPDPQLACPIHVVYGESDPEVDVPRLQEWERCTHADSPTKPFPGDHFYLAEQLSQVVGYVCDVSTRATRSPS